MARAAPRPQIIRIFESPGLAPLSPAHSGRLHISRGKGARVTRAAAYRAGERIRDERTGEVYDHSDRQDVAYKEVVLAADLAGRPDMAWTQDRATLWNAAEHAGRRCNSRLAREFLVLVPPELTPQQRVRLVHDFAQGLADR